MESNSSQNTSAKSSTGRIKFTIIGIVISLAIVVSLVAIKASQFGDMMAAGEQMVMPPEPINTVIVNEHQWQSQISSVGTVNAVQGTIISAELEGVVRSINFQAGAFVNAGDPLVHFDLEVEQAQLRSAEAALEGALFNFNRAKELVGSKSVSQSDFTAADVALKQARAEVDNMRAIIARKVVRAPFAGKLGIRQISIGQFLNRGDAIVSLFALSPVYVEFSLPQQRLSEISEGLAVNVTSDSYANEIFTGKITAINPNIDINTRNVRVQATFANEKSELRPGMFVSINLNMSQSETVLLIPASAVQHAPFGDSVFVVEAADNADGNQSMIIQQQLVTLGKRQGDFVIATKGLTAGQQIVSAGVFKLRPGMQVVIDNTLAPDFKLNAAPDNT